MKSFRRTIGCAIGVVMSGFLVVCASSAFAAAAGSVTYLSGTLSARKADGTARILAQKSEIENGDTLTTERDSYVQLRFADGSQVTMKPNSSLKIGSVKFSEDKPKEDSFVVGLLKGGMRTVTGLVGARSQDKVQVTTETGTIGIRGTSFSVDDCVRRDVGGECGSLEPGVYLSVVDGRVIVQNEAGEEVFGAGEFGLIQGGKRPAFLPTDPGLKFVPPATFRSSAIQGSSPLNLGRDLECVVR